ncbi:MAG: PEP-CTERM sorting domain-containing protein, partial [Planctomycetota bacterium]
KSHRVLFAVPVVAAAASPAAGQLVASALVTEGSALPGDSAVIVDTISNVAANGVGGWGVTLADTDSLSRVYATSSLDPSTLTLLRSEGDVLAEGTVTGVESFFGISDTLDVLNGLVIDGDEAIYRNSIKAILEPEATPVPGTFWTFGSGPDISSGGLGHFVGGFGTVQGGGTQARGVFSVDDVGDVKPLIVAGDVVGGTGGEIVGSSASPGFGGGVSADGTFYAYEVALDALTSVDGIIVVNDVAATSAGGGLLREGMAIEAAAGGLAGEAWDNFDAVKINEAGTLLVTGDTAGDFNFDEFLYLGDQIVLREGDAIGAGTVDGAIEWADLNESGDWAVIWDVDFGSGDVEVLIVNGEIVLVEGDAVDSNNDGVVDSADAGTLSNFTGLRNVALGERINGVVDVYFTADVDTLGTTGSGDDLESAFRVSVVIPEPGSIAMLGAGALTLLRRRR